MSSVPKGNHESAWRAANIDARSSWYYDLSNQCLRALGTVAARADEGGIAPADLEIDTSALGPCHGCLKAVSESLISGRGFAIVERLPVESVSPIGVTAMYWALGHLIGTPRVQDKQGTLLFDVRDTGQDVREGARFSVTNAESGYHTDCAFNPGIPEVVGLLCLQTAKTGGRSQLVSAYAVHDELAERFPQELATLYEPFHFDRRGQHEQSEPPTLPFPIFATAADHLCTRYMRYYIQVGQERLGKPLSSAQERALGVMDEAIRADGMNIEFDLRPGQMLFASNRWILHNRTAFEDHAEPERRRHYVRLWLTN